MIRCAMTGLPMEVGDGIYEDGAWISWNWINGQLYKQEIQREYPKVDADLALLFEDLVENAALTAATNDTRAITAATLYGLKCIYRLGYQYKKAGVMLMDLMPDTVRQGQLFKEADGKSEQIMKLLDGLNWDYGKNTLYLASCGIQHRWSTLLERRTPRYTTRWDELPKAMT